MSKFLDNLYSKFKDIKLWLIAYAATLILTFILTLIRGTILNLGYIIGMIFASLSFPNSFILHLLWKFNLIPENLSSISAFFDISLVIFMFLPLVLFFIGISVIHKAKNKKLVLIIGLFLIVWLFFNLIAMFYSYLFF